tara:strand:+ start:1570 stop:2031 length:462 start_codon:yes stop_codon:yes gene_type:complete
MVIMSLLIKPSEDVYDYYSGLKTSSSTDSGFDLIIPKDIVIPKNSLGFKIHLGIRCQPQFDDAVPRGFYLYPRSSTGSKTPLRLSNGTGIIDFEYRGEIIACVDNISDIDYHVSKGMRLFQLCSPDLSPIVFKIAENLNSTSRSEGGYGSTGS